MIRLKKITINLLLLLTVIVISLLFFEVFLRITGSESFPKEGNFKFVKHSYYNPFLIFGPNINHTITRMRGFKPVYFNSQGFRQKEELPLEKGFDEYRLFALGGSTTENLGWINTSYCEEVNKILGPLEIKGKHLNCVNAGKAAYTTAHSLIRLQFDLLAFKPDIVTIMHNINDLVVNFFPSGDRTNYGNTYLSSTYAPTLDDLSIFEYHIKPWLKKLKISFFFYFKLKDIKQSLGAQNSLLNTMRINPNPTELKFKESFRNNIISLSRIAKAHNITLVWMSQPGIFLEEKIVAFFGMKSFNHYVLYPEKDELKKLFEEYNHIIEEVAKEENVDFIDMYTLMGNNPDYFTDVVHYSPKGIHKFSEIYGKELNKIMSLN